MSDTARGMELMIDGMSDIPCRILLDGARDARHSMHPCGA
jgi:hypothetical protein